MSRDGPSNVHVHGNQHFDALENNIQMLSFQWNHPTHPPGRHHESAGYLSISTLMVANSLCSEYCKLFLFRFQKAYLNFPESVFRLPRVLKPLLKYFELTSPLVKSAIKNLLEVELQITIPIKLCL